MKEWLLKTEDGKYHYYHDDMDCCPKCVEKIKIPEGAIEARLNKGGSLNFIKSDGAWMNNMTNGEWFGPRGHSEHPLVWERKNHTMKNIYISGGTSIKGNLSVEGTLAERQKSYGCFEDVATVTEEIIKALKIGNYDNMPKPHKMAMYMIASKMARLVNGDFNHLDSWHDIGGYSKLIEKLIGGENE